MFRRISYLAAAAMALLISIPSMADYDRRECKKIYADIRIEYDRQGKELSRL